MVLYWGGGGLPGRLPAKSGTGSHLLQVRSMQIAC